jgi:hypothetical protein
MIKLNKWAVDVDDDHRVYEDNADVSISAYCRNVIEMISFYKFVFEERVIIQTLL